jgi:sugar lactone lactonase YvrE
VVLERDGHRQTLIDGLDEPTGLVANDDTLFVADRAEGTITRVTPRGVSVVARHLIGPEGLALDANEHLLVVESGAGRISEIEPCSGAARTLATGLALGLPGIPGTPPSFAFNGITRDERGRVFVTGDGADLVYVLTADEAMSGEARPSR